MKKNISLSLLLLFCFIAYSQCPTSDIILSSQGEIDNFSINYPNCSVLTHQLKVDGDLSLITNLNGLSNLTNTQDIFIISTDITSLEGLHNAVTISSFALWGNSNLQNMEGLSSLVDLGHFEIWINNSITNLAGMDSLQSINNIHIFGNSSLEDISQLSFLTSLGGGLTLNSNALTSLNGLQNLQVVEQDIAIANEDIQNFDELNNLHTIGRSLYLLDNSGVQNISAFNNIESVSDLYILNCSNLQNLQGLENITTVDGTLRIGFNSGLTDLSFIKNITSVGYLDIYENQNLQTLQGIESLKNIGERLFIDNNPSLISIEALDYQDLPSNIQEVVIMNNSSLQICDTDFICSIINDGDVSKHFINNAAGCSSIQEVGMNCSLDDFVDVNQVTLFPNPAIDLITISINETNTLKNVKIYSVFGKLILETTNSQINLNSYLSGVYIAEIITNNGIFVKRIVKK